MRDQWRAEKRRSTLLVDDELARFRRNLRLDVVDVVRELLHVAVGGLHASGIDVAGGVDHRHTGPPRCRKQPLGGWERLPGVLAARAGELPIDLSDWPVSA